MTYRYDTFSCWHTDLHGELNRRAEEGWKLHTVLSGEPGRDDPEFRVRVVVEKVVDPGVHPQIVVQDGLDYRKLAGMIAGMIRSERRREGLKVGQY